MVNQLYNIIKRIIQVKLFEQFTKLLNQSTFDMNDDMKKPTSWS